MLLAGATAATVSLTRSGHAQADAEWQKVIADAKREGEVSLYSAVIGSPQPKRVAKLFTDRYGIKVNIFDGRPTEIHERLRIESAMKKYTADVTLNGSTTLALLIDQKLIAPRPQVPNFKRVVLEPSHPQEIPVFVNAYGILVNNTLVPPSEAPKSWLDLLDPKWKGKILSDEMNATGAGATTFGVLQDRFGTDFHRKLAKQDLTFSRIIRENGRRVARGEFSIYIPLILTDVGMIEGLPVRPVIPEEGAAYTPFSVAMIEDAPHPNAAKLLMNFFVEPEAQIVYAEAGYPIAVGGLQDKTPEKWRWSVNAKLLGRQKLDGQDERLKLADEIYHGKK
jgi:iron(III) transport system substrate-binding protein